MTTAHRLHRFTQYTLKKIQPGGIPSATATTLPLLHPAVNLEQLTRFAAVILLHEAETVPFPPDSTEKLSSKEVTKKCTVSKWESKLSGRKHHSDDENRDDGHRQEEEEPVLPTSRAGVIFVTTTTGREHDKKAKDEDGSINNGNSERLTSFLFARYEQSMPELQARLKTDLLPPSKPGNTPDEDPESLMSVPSRIQQLIEDRGMTRLWLCGTDPAYRRHNLMASNLRQLEQEVLRWRNRGFEEDGGGGDRIRTSEDKAFYWKIS
ncbi:hypothetical protein BGX33_007812 [Mortierella sp. NVP41]|nr:hypothetical protein BGX33_007812 [Mortierella sp. NVP41]